jgi:RimJ/RimL family protein N-acetyltransferase
VSLTVRAATVDDAAAVNAVRFAAWRAAYHRYLPAAAFDDIDQDAVNDRWRAGLVRGQREAIVAERDGSIVGFCSYGRCRDDDRPDAGEIYALYARPEQWSTGVGRALMAAALPELAGRPVVLWVLRDNARARRFYEIAGFVADGSARITTMIGGIPLPEVRYQLGHVL